MNGPRYYQALTKGGVVGELGVNKLCAIELKFEAHYSYAGPDKDGNPSWQPMPVHESYDGRFFIEKKDGSLNTSTIDRLKAVYGWDGATPYWFEDQQGLSEDYVLITVEDEVYNGKTRARVAWVNRKTDRPGGGMQPSTPEGRRAIESRIGSKLRAHSGGMRAPAPPVPAGGPAPVTPSRAPTVPAAPSQALTLDAAWAQWLEACKGDNSKAQHEWSRLVIAKWPGVRLDDSHAADIVALIENIPPF